MRLLQSRHRLLLIYMYPNNMNVDAYNQSMPVPDGYAARYDAGAGAAGQYYDAGAAAAPQYMEAASCLS